MNDIDFQNEMRDRFAHIESELEVIKVKLGMIERIVYGAVGLVLVGVLTAAMALLIRQ